MRSVAALLLASAAIDWPAIVLDRQGVALMGLAALALSLPAMPRRRKAAADRVQPPAIFSELEYAASRAAAAAERELEHDDLERAGL